MSNKIYCIILFWILLGLQNLGYGQGQYSDAPMRVKLTVDQLYVESTDDPIGNDEYGWNVWVQDNDDLDGTGFLFTGPFKFDFPGAGWFNFTDTDVFNHDYITNASPRFLNVDIEGWESDCYDCFRCTGTFLGVCVIWECDQCQNNRNFYNANCPCSQNILCGCSNDDQHCGRLRLQDIDFRAFVPAQNNNLQYISAACGTNDVGARLILFY
ncbi:MAG: hypothetical protein NZ108_07230, partial [Bacteroidia bacterium]|nr:hypothetical protein [Bacteroidia bacterium]